MAVLAAVARKMRRRTDHTTIAQGYADCADESIRRANNAINETARRYFVLIAAEYLLVAKQELRAIERGSSASRPHPTPQLSTVLGLI
jgi:7-cyano-7-deazaguanine synthase in queuosine biosynthesis